MVRRLRAAGLLTAMVAATGCTSYRVETRPLPEVVPVEEPRSIRLTLRDDRTVELYQPTVANDSLRGHLTPTAVRRLTYPLASIQSASIRRFHLGRTALMVFGVIGGVVVYDQLMGLNNTP